MVKLTLSLLIASAVASSALAQGNFAARDVASLSAQDSLFGRAALKVISDLYSREELSELFGRDVDELSLRDLEELLERDTEGAEGAATAASPPAHAAAAGAPAATGAAAGAPTATGAAAGSPKSPAATGTAAAAPTATSTAAPAATTPSGPVNPIYNIVSIVIKRLANFLKTGGFAPPATTATKGAPAAAATTSAVATSTKTASSSAAAPTATSAAAHAGGAAAAADPADSTAAEHPEARSEWLYEEPIERSLDYAGQFEDMAEREFDDFDDFEAREYDDLEDSFERRAYGSGWNEQVFRRALDILLEELD